MPLIEVKEKYLNMMPDLQKSHSDYRYLNHDYHLMIKRYRNADNGINASSIFTQSIRKAKEIANKIDQIPPAETGYLFDFNNCETIR